MSIESELLAIKGSDEFLIAEDVVEWARANPGSDLHKSLEWDDRVAAVEYRLHQVRRLIAIHVTYSDGSRKFVSLSIDRTRDRGGYRDIDDVLQDQTLHAVMLADALRELERVQARYNELQALQPVWQAAAQVRRRARPRGRQQRQQRGGGTARATT
jgi:hypothetical protein